MSIVVEEADESVFWLELLTDTGVVKKDRLFRPSVRGERDSRHLHRFPSHRQTESCIMKKGVNQ